MNYVIILYKTKTNSHLCSYIIIQIHAVVYEVTCKKRNAEWNGIWNGTWNRIWNALSLLQVCQLCDHTHSQEVNYHVIASLSILIKTSLTHAYYISVATVPVSHIKSS